MKKTEFNNGKNRIILEFKTSTSITDTPKNNKIPKKIIGQFNDSR